MTDTVLTEALAALRARFRERVTVTAAAREAHGRSESYHAPHLPDAVVFPASTAEVVDLVSICRVARVPLTGFGAGTSLEGNATPLFGGVSVDFTRMNAVLAVNAEDLDCRVQPLSLHAREPVTTARGSHPGYETCLIDVDVAQPGHPRLVQQRSLHRTRCAPDDALELGQ